MKRNFGKLIFAAGLAFGLVACQKEVSAPEANQSTNSPVVYFSTTVNDLTKASLTPNEADSYFKADWEENDNMAIAAFLDDECYTDQLLGTWDSDNKAFAVSCDDLTNVLGEEWGYVGIYPAPDEKGWIEFGSTRTQNGNNHNGKYDVMMSDVTNLTLEEGQTVTLEMNRLTSIQYFHLTSSNDEALVSAELEVEGENAYIAGDILAESGSIDTDGTSNKITITFGENAPSASDCKLWFNVLPTEYTSLTLTVKTETKVATITKSTSNQYEPGKLYKVVKDGLNWEDRDDLLPFDEDFDNITVGNNTSSSGSGTSVSAFDIPQFNATFTSAYKAGCAIRLGKGGIITTRNLDLTSDFRVWAKIKGWANTEKELGVMVGETIKTMTATNTITGDFTWHSVDFDGTSDYSTVTFTTGENIRVFIDRIYIGPKDCPAPKEYNLAVDTEEITLEHTLGSTATFNVTSNYAWTSEISGNGFTIDPSSADGDALITVTSLEAGREVLATLGTITISDGKDSKTITIKQKATPDGFMTDILTANMFGATSGISYGTIEDKSYDGEGHSNAVYSGNMNRNVSYIQIRNQSPSGVISTTSGGLIRKVVVTWATSTATTNNRKVKVYGTNTAYSGLADLYDENKRGTELGEIIKGDNAVETLTIDSDYKYIGLKSDGAVYMDQIAISWGEPKPQWVLGFYNGETLVNEALEATVGTDFTAPILKADGEIPTTTISYASNDTDVAEVNSTTGAITLKKKGSAIITVTVAGDSEHSETSASYTLNVANVLSSITLTETENISFTVGDDFSLSPVRVIAHYNDETTADVTESTNISFSGFDSSAVAASQEITVSYTEAGITKTAKYNIMIKAQAFKVNLPSTQDGNSVTINGGGTSFEENDAITLDITTATGYHLESLTVDGTDVTSSVANSQYIFTMPGHDVTVAAIFAKDTHTARFYINGETNSSNDVTVAFGDAIKFPADPSITGANFEGWSTSVISNTVETKPTVVKSATMGTTDITYYSVFSVGGATVSLTQNEIKMSTAVGSYGDIEVTSASGTWTGKAIVNTSTGYIQINKNSNNYHLGTPTFSKDIKSITIHTTNNTASGRTAYLRADTSTAQPTSSQIGSASSSADNGDIIISSISGSYKKLYIYVSGGVYISGVDVVTGSAVYCTTVPEIEHEPESLNKPTNLTWTANSKILSWTDSNTSKGTYGTDYKYQYSVDGGSTWSNASNATSVTLSITQTTTVNVKAVALTTGFSDSEAESIECTISGGGSTGGTTLLTINNFSFTSAQDVTITTNDSNITLVAHKGSSGTNPGNYNNGIRLYQASSTSSTGGYITLKAENSKKIVSVIITATSTYATSVQSKIDDSDTMTAKTSVAKSGTYEVPLDSTGAEKVEIYNVGTGNNGRLEIAKIELLYK